jgi:prepilin-type N-terminal cleavage/methylation domain-containing protein
MKTTLPSTRDRQSAFTLIELLVVISIIAILAGILFPVFAQAKIAAKQAASISNVKQIALSCLLYSNDYDDGLPLFANGNAENLGLPSPRVDSWVWQTQPYVKNLSLLIDPLMGDPNGIFGSGPESTFYNQDLFPDYGLNYAFLAPWMRDPGTGECTWSGSVTSSGGSHPSSTIYFTTTYLPNKNGDYVPTGGYSDYGSYIVTAPAVISLASQQNTHCISTGMDWSEHPAGFNSGMPFMAEASSRYHNGGVDAMLDGHAKYLTIDQEAAGTDWATSAYLHTKIVSASRYLWDYDDTFFGSEVPE